MGKTCQTLSGHTDHVTSLAFAPDAGELVSVGCDGRVVVWDLTAPVAKQLHRIQSAHTGPIHAVAMSPDGTVFVTGAADKTVHVWSTTPTSDLGRTRGARSKPAEKTPTGESRGEHVEPEVTLKLQGHLSDVTCCAFGRTAASLATGSLDHSVMLWNPSAGTHVGILVGHSAPVCDVSYSRDGRFLVSASRDHHVRLWHPRSGETVLTLRQSAGALTARLSPDASRCWWAPTTRPSPCGVGSEGGSASMGQNPQRPQLFARGHALRDDDAETAATDASGSLTDRSDGSGRSRHTASSIGRKVDRNPLAFDGQAHKGATNCVAAFFAPLEDDAPDSSAGVPPRANPPGSSSAARRDREARGAEKTAARLPVLTGGDDGYVRKISTVRGETGKVTMTFKGHAKAIRAWPPPRTCPPP